MQIFIEIDQDLVMIGNEEATKVGFQKMHFYKGSLEYGQNRSFEYGSIMFPCMPSPLRQHSLQVQFLKSNSACFMIFYHHQILSNLYDILHIRSSQVCL